MMMKIKTSVIFGVFSILKDARLTKMEDADKFKVIRALRKFKAISAEFEDAQKDALEKLKGENHDEMVAKAQRWQSEGAETTLTEDERKEINAYFGKYNSDVTKCIQDIADKNNEVEFETLTDSAFEKLMASNDWTANVALEIADILV